MTVGRQSFKCGPGERKVTGPDGYPRCEPIAQSLPAPIAAPQPIIPEPKAPATYAPQTQTAVPLAGQCADGSCGTLDQQLARRAVAVGTGQVPRTEYEQMSYDALHSGFGGPSGRGSFGGHAGAAAQQNYVTAMNRAVENPQVLAEIRARMANNETLQQATANAINNNFAAMNNYGGIVRNSEAAVAATQKANDESAARAYQAGAPWRGAGVSLGGDTPTYAGGLSALLPTADGRGFGISYGTDTFIAPNQNTPGMLVAGGLGITGVANKQQGVFDAANALAAKQAQGATDYSYSMGLLDKQAEIAKRERDAVYDQWVKQQNLLAEIARTRQPSPEEILKLKKLETDLKLAQARLADMAGERTQAPTGSVK